MMKMFERNIGTAGRLVRAALAAVLFVAGGLLIQERLVIGIFLLGSGVFVLFEALRGWCALRACGIATKF